MRSWALFLVLLAAQVAVGDIFMHNPRGSNNRLNGAGTNRSNNNRLFDTQNNNKGGYNHGVMYYYTGSIMPVEWTAQHGCGGNENLFCNFVIQYMCEDHMRDGTTENTPPAPEPIDAPGEPEDGECCANPPSISVGVHESQEYYFNCTQRARNRGLFWGAQSNRNREKAINTRQNAGGTRRGYECPEERDYYPYWHPTPWKDVAVLTDEPEKRCAYYQAESENVKGRGYCLDPAYNNKAFCEQEGKPGRNVWVESTGHGMAPPDCIGNQYSRDNHHGNAVGGYMANYWWILPNVTASSCVLRLRYNMSSDDMYGMDYFWLNSTYNINNPDGDHRIANKISNDPRVEELFDLKLKVTPSQFPRTFEDRSHTFEIRERPVKDTTRIWNLNVRGKRGNIVQTYPAVEYDFTPQVLHIEPGDYVHFQWTGSNSNPNGNAGQGRAGSDRSNIVQIANLATNYPVAFENMTMFSDPHTYRRIATLDQNDDELDDASPYFDAGLVKFTDKGTHAYMCTRNNNFSNRGQKGLLVVEDFPGTKHDGAVRSETLVVVPVVGVLVAAFAGAMMVMVKKARVRMPGSPTADTVPLRAAPSGATPVGTSVERI